MPRLSVPTAKSQASMDNLDDNLCLEGLRVFSVNVLIHCDENTKNWYLKQVSFSTNSTWNDESSDHCYNSLKMEGQKVAKRRHLNPSFCRKTRLPAPYLGRGSNYTGTVGMSGLFETSQPSTASKRCNPGEENQVQMISLPKRHEKYIWHIPYIPLSVEHGFLYSPTH